MTGRDTSTSDPERGERAASARRRSLRREPRVAGGLPAVHEAVRRRTRQLIDLLPHPCLVTDAAGGIRYANEASARLTEQPLEQLVGSCITDMAGVDSRRILEQLSTAGDAARVPVGHPAATSACGAVTWTVSSLEAEEGDAELLWQATTAAVDCSPARGTLSGAELEREYACAQVLEESRSEIYIFDAGSLHFERVNRGARENLGYTAAELRAMTPLDLKAELTREAFERLTEPLRRGDAPEVRFESTHRRKDGSFYPVDVHLQMSWVGAQRVYVALILDMTERRRSEHAARVSSERLHAVVEAAADGIITIGESGTIQTVNPAVARIFGYPQDLLIGRDVSVLMPEPYRGRQGRYLRSVFAAGDRRIIGVGREVLGRRKDGTTFPLELTISEAEVEGERIFTGTVRDITERKQIQERERQLIWEQAAREAAERAQREATFLVEISEALASSLDLSQMLDRLADRLIPRLGDWCVIDLINDAGELRTAGVRATDPAAETTLRSVMRRYPAGGLLSRQDTAGATALSEPRLVLDVDAELLAGLARDADHLLALQSLAPSCFMHVPLIAGGRTAGILTVAASGSERSFDGRDLGQALEVARRAALAMDHARLYERTLRDRADAEKLAARQRQLHAIAVATTDALDPEELADRVLTKAMAALGAETGMIALVSGDGSEFEVLRLSGLVGERHADWLRFPVTAQLPVSETIHYREPVFVESAAVARDEYPELQKFSPCEGWAALPLLLEGNPIGAMAFGFAEPQTFLEEEREFLMAVAHNTAQALERTRLFAAERSARAQAEWATQARDEVLGIVAHDLRSPLSGIQMLASVLLKRLPAGDPDQDSLQSILQGARMMERLIEDLLDVRRVEAGHLRIAPAPLVVASVVSKAVDMLELRAAAAGVELVVDLPADLPSVTADGGRILQVLANLLENAIRFTPERGTVTVRAEAAGDSLRIQVADTGLGMEPDQLAHIFDRFWQAHAAGRGGAGLGLIIVKGIVEAHGGAISAESTAGHGTTMTFTLPAHREYVERAPSPADPAGFGVQPAPLFTSADPPRRLLVVDDHPTIRRGLRELLAGHPGFVIAGEAETGEQALELAGELNPDIVIMDLAMPGMGGLEATRRLTRLHPDIRVLTVTSDTTNESLLPVLAAGASGCIRKSSVHEELLDALRTVARNEAYLYPDAARILLQAYRAAEQRTGELFDSLPDQEREVLRLVAEGYTSKEIGRQLHLSPHTVDTYRSQLMRTLGLGHRSDVVRFALKAGLLQAGRGT
jgi:PAS domain S-box-containing protein